MKKIYLAKRNAWLSPASFSLGALALSVVALLVALRFAFPNAFLSLTMPVVRSGNSLSAGVYYVSSSFSNAAALVQEKDSLTEQNQKLAVENRTLAAQVADLRALLGDTSTPSPLSGVVAGVLARPPVAPYDVLVVGAGTNQGVRAGMEAFAYDHVPVGVVTSVTTSFARVTLFSAPGEELSAWIGTERLAVMLRGTGAGAFSVQAPRAANIAEGDTVFAPGPGALPIGTVRRIDGDPAAPTVTIHIAPAVNPFSLSTVVLRDVGTALTDALTSEASTTP